MSIRSSRSLFARLWAQLIPAGTPVIVKPVDVPEYPTDANFIDVPAATRPGLLIADAWSPRPHITDQADDYADDPRIISHGQLVVFLADGRTLCRPSQVATWRLYRNNRPLGPYWYRLDTALGHLLGQPQTGRAKAIAMAALTPDDPQLPAEEAPNA